MPEAGVDERGEILRVEAGASRVVHQHPVTRRRPGRRGEASQPVRHRAAPVLPSLGKQDLAPEPETEAAEGRISGRQDHHHGAHPAIGREPPDRVRQHRPAGQRSELLRRIHPETKARSGRRDEPPDRAACGFTHNLPACYRISCVDRDETSTTCVGFQAAVGPLDVA